MVKAAPFIAPWRWSASIAYAEQLGKNLHDAGKIGESTVW
jgi:hypothetical protein